MGTKPSIWERVRETLLDLFFPPHCPCCGRITEGGVICPRCMERLPRTQGEQAVRTLEDGLLCAAPFWYEGAAREAILALKFRGRSHGATPLGEFLAECAAECFSGEFDTVTWVPVSAARRRSRGYDQAELLARSACRLWDTEPLPLLEKVRDNPAQSGLNDAAARRQNVQDVYRVREGADVAARRILLIDDVCTTGSTLSECARTLRNAGAEEVFCTVVTLTRFRQGNQAKREREESTS